jgi:uncharacterized cupin superfamily protein
LIAKQPACPDFCANFAGDSFVMKPGFVGVWRTLETVRKIYVCVYD